MLSDDMIAQARAEVQEHSDGTGSLTMPHVECTHLLAIYDDLTAARAELAALRAEKEEIVLIARGVYGAKPNELLWGQTDLQFAHMMVATIRHEREERAALEAQLAEARKGLATAHSDGIRAAITRLWARVGSEEYGHAKAAVTLDIEALEALLSSPVQAAESAEAQRRSFAFGNVSISNPNVTREIVDGAADKLTKEASESAEVEH